MKFHQLYFIRLCQAILSKHACMCDVQAAPFTRCDYCAGIRQSCQTTMETRKPPHYQRNIWAHEFFESLHNHYQERSYIRRIEKLKEDVRQLLLECMVGSSAKLELIDAIQRLGIGYHFMKEIKKTIEFMWFNQGAFIGNDLHSVALYFRLLRQHGYQVSQDVFAGFLDHTGNFLEELSKDVKGMLSLYQASYLCLDGENIMREANMFTVRNLSGQRQRGVTHALELPLHWRMSRLEGRWYIEETHREQNIHPCLLELSQMDFNFVQRIHQKELHNMFKWWRELDLSSSLSFARDRLVESFLWSVGLAYEPQHGRCRGWLTKVISFILTIDDIYDIHGSLDELERFTNAVERWDDEAIEYLPDYMKICFLALYNTTNDMAYTIYTEQTWDILPYLRKVWEDYCKAMLLEANWSNKKYTPSLEEYLANAWVSSSTPVGLVHAFFASKQKITDGVLECLYKSHEPIRSSSLIFRLWNDLATSSVELQRGDVPSAVQCYMRDNNTTEDFAREKIKGLITNMWKVLNESMYDSPFDHTFVIIAINHVRNGHCFYQHGDGFSVQDHEAKERVKALLVKPFVLRGGESCDTCFVNSHISKEEEEWERENKDPEEGSKHTNMENQDHVEF